MEEGVRGWKKRMRIEERYTRTEEEDEDRGAGGNALCWPLSMGKRFCFYRKRNHRKRRELQKINGQRSHSYESKP